MSGTDDELEPVTVEITVDTGPFMGALHRAQAAALFALHPDLGDLGDSLSNLYGSSFED